MLLKSNNTFGQNRVPIFVSFCTRTRAENTDSLMYFDRGKYHCTADFLFDFFGFDQTCKSVSNSTYTKQLNPNQSNRMSSVQ